MILVGVAFLIACFLVIGGGRKTSRKKIPKTGHENKAALDAVFTKSEPVDANQSDVSKENDHADVESDVKNEPVAVATSITDFNDDSVIYDVMAQMSDYGHVYNQNLFLPTKDGDIHLIHHVSLAPTGFYLFTFLNVGKTYIIGTEDSKWWTRFRTPESKDYMDNPVLAIDKEVKLLKTFFPKTADSDYHTYIVLNNTCEIRDIELRENGNVRVLNSDALRDTLMNDSQEHDQVFDQNALIQMQKVIDVLKSDEDLTERLSALKDDMRAEQAIAKATAQTESVEKKAEEEMAESEEKALPKDVPEGKFTPSELNLRNSLFVWRGQEMSVNTTDDTHFIDDDMIDAIVEAKPKSVEELYYIDGLSDAVIERYGQTIVSMTSHTP